MNWTENYGLKIAILDLNEGKENQGMRCIREIVNQFSDVNNIDLLKEEFDVRCKRELPDIDFDVYISSGGPGSPLDSEGSEWEEKYFNWIKTIVDYNNLSTTSIKKQIFFICHSFQLATRFFKVAQVLPRKSTSFGVFPIHSFPVAKNEICFDGLTNPFYVVDSRDYQVIQPNHNRIKELGAAILAIEKARPHVPLERAIMGIRFNENMIGTQFHPEADAIGMSINLQKEDKKKTVIENHGEVKWKSMIEQLQDPEKIMHTYAHILPNFLKQAVEKMQAVSV